MIKVEGYKAFRGTMIIKAYGNMPEERITADWLYKPGYDCWYGKGQSFPAEICEVAEGEIKKYIDEDLLKKKIEEAKESIYSDDDKTWDKNKDIYRGLCWVEALLCRVPKITAIESAEEIKTKTVSRWETIKSDEDMKDLLNKFDTMCAMYRNQGCLGCKYGDSRSSERCPTRFFLEKIEVEDCEE